MQRQDEISDVMEDRKERLERSLCIWAELLPFLKDTTTNHECFDLPNGDIFFAKTDAFQAGVPEVQ